MSPDCTHPWDEIQSPVLIRQGELIVGVRGDCGGCGTTGITRFLDPAKDARYHGRDVRHGGSRARHGGPEGSLSGRVMGPEV